MSTAAALRPGPSRSESVRVGATPRGRGTGDSAPGPRRALAGHAKTLSLPRSVASASARVPTRASPATFAAARRRRRRTPPAACRRPPSPRPLSSRTDGRTLPAPSLPQCRCALRRGVGPLAAAECRWRDRPATAPAAAAHAGSRKLVDVPGRRIMAGADSVRGQRFVFRPMKAQGVAAQIGP
jgi:hypothetical protein